LLDGLDRAAGKFRRLIDEYTERLKALERVENPGPSGNDVTGRVGQPPKYDVVVGYVIALQEADPGMTWKSLKKKCQARFTHTPEHFERTIRRRLQDLRDKGGLQ